MAIRRFHSGFTVPAGAGTYAPEITTFAPPVPLPGFLYDYDYAIRGLVANVSQAVATAVIELWLLTPGADPTLNASYAFFSAVANGAALGGASIPLAYHVGAQIRVKSGGTAGTLIGDFHFAGPEAVAAAAVSSVMLKSTNADGFAGWTNSRAGNGTYYDTNRVVQTATTNVSRNGASGAAHYLDAADGRFAHWLLEPSRLNSALWCRDFTNVAWTKSFCTIGGSVTGADGTAAMTTLGVIGANAVNTLIDGALNLVNAAAYAWTASTFQANAIMAKPGNKSWVICQHVRKDGTFATSWVNFTTGAIGSTPSASHAIKVWQTAFGYRAEVELASSLTGASGQFFAFGFVDADNSHTLTGDGATVNGYFDYAQMENDQPYSTSSIATTSAAVTRPGDAVPFRNHNSAPQSRSLYAELTELTPATQGNNTFLGLGLGGALVDWFRLEKFTPYRGQSENNPSVASTGTMGVSPALGDHVQARTVSDAVATPNMTFGGAINGGAENVQGPTSMVHAYNGSYSSGLYSVGANDGGVVGHPMALRALKDVLGVQSLATLAAV